MPQHLAIDLGQSFTGKRGPHWPTTKAHGLSIGDILRYPHSGPLNGHIGMIRTLSTAPPHTPTKRPGDKYLNAYLIRPPGHEGDGYLAGWWHTDTLEPTGERVDVEYRLIIDPTTNQCGELTAGADLNPPHYPNRLGTTNRRVD